MDDDNYGSVQNIPFMKSDDNSEKWRISTPPAVLDAIWLRGCYLSG